MRFIGDFHTHSHFSVATSKNLVPEQLEYWAKMKGIAVVGTGDFTHPGWFAELKDKLQPAEPGLYALKEEYRIGAVNGISPPDKEVRFVLTAEVSNIYKRNDRVRKVHNLIFAPDFDAALKIQHRLSEIGNITSDGRPILGLDSRDLLEIVLESSERCFFVPSHIWTPWFSALGAKSGFDSIDECYADLAGHIHAVETGLSSDPPMNWLCSFLDRFTIISNSDAHSPEKLGREANLFDTGLDYASIIGAMKGEGSAFLGTVEFFPQEGKYHYDGHRKCGVRMNPLESLKCGECCPVCGKKLTIGVLSRVTQLADRDDPAERVNRHGFHSLVPLRELLSEIHGVGVQSKQVGQIYHSLIRKGGTELELLIEAPVDEIQRIGGAMLAEGVRRMRSGDVCIEEGYDGEYGRIRVFDKSEIASLGQYGSLFSTAGVEFDARVPESGRMTAVERGNFDFDVHEYRRLKTAAGSVQAQRTDETYGERIEREGTQAHSGLPLFSQVPAEAALFSDLNPEQRRALMHGAGPALVLAGPGTGKTRVLASRAARLVLEGVDPRSILAVTFTNRAAAEMTKRIQSMLDVHRVSQGLQISTFHAFGLVIIGEQLEKTGRAEPFSIIEEDDRRELLSMITGAKAGAAEKLSESITQAKKALVAPEDIPDPDLQSVFAAYENELRANHAFDLDDLISLPAFIFRKFPDILDRYRSRFQWVLIDEYQDINNAQYQLIRMLMPSADANLFAIGDPDQAIYGFRGADVRFIDSFMEDYPHAMLYVLKKSYRCSNHILKASRGMMGQGTQRSGVLEGLSAGVKVQIAEQGSDRSEAEFVARTIERMMGGLRFFSMDSDITEGSEERELNSLAEFAVLCRIREQMNAVEEAFANHSIPYQAVGSVPFYREEPFRSIIDFMKLSTMPENTFIRTRLMKKKILRSGERVMPFPEGMKVRSAAEQLVAKYFNEERVRHELPFQRFFRLCDQFGEFSRFFQHLDLGTGSDLYQAGTERVALMTLHAAKGLEFSCVFIIGCEEGLIPYTLFEHRETDRSEEKRLLYVGMTRAQRFLILSHARRRFLFGREFRLPRSLFLDSIEEELLERVRSEYPGRQMRTERQLDLF